MLVLLINDKNLQVEFSKQIVIFEYKQEMNVQSFLI